VPARNDRLVQALLSEVGFGADVRLWALNEAAPRLADQTVGWGQGTRFAHFNFLNGSRSVEESFPALPGHFAIPAIGIRSLIESRVQGFLSPPLLIERYRLAVSGPVPNV
jgi:hypothetical protein